MRTKNDCLRQCVARVVGRPVHRVPHFVKKYGGRWSYHLARWLERVGFVMIYVVRGKGSRVVATEGVRSWILIGPTSGKRKRPCHHAVVMSARPFQAGRVTWDGGIPLKRVDRTLYILPKAAR